MSTRLLYFFSFLACVVAAYLYYYKDSMPQQAKTVSERYDYWANDVAAIQTDEQGRKEVAVNARRVVHDPTTDVLRLQQIEANMAQAAKAEQPASNITFSADTATWQHTKHLIDLKGNVTAVRQLQGEKVTQSHASDMVFLTDALQAHTKNKTIAGTHPVTLTMQHSFIKMNGIRADLSRGEYQFDQLHAQFTP